jgi:hypothetical protein
MGGWVSAVEVPACCPRTPWPRARRAAKVDAEIIMIEIRRFDGKKKAEKMSKLYV